MKIFFDGHIFVDQIFGGISRYFSQLVSSLNRIDNVNAKIIAPLYRNVYLSQSNASRFGIKVSHTLRTGRLSWIALKNLSPIVSTFERPDIIHETYFHHNVILPGRKKRVTTVYDMIHEKYFPDSETILAKQKSLERCDHIFCISKNTQKDLCEIYNFPMEKTSVTYLSFKNFSSFNNNNLTGFNNNKPYILYVGNRSFYKNFIRLLKAVSYSKILIKDFNIIAFGGGKFTDEEKQFIKDLKLDKKNIIQITGDDKLLGQAYANATVYVNTSKYEGFGIPPLEAMSSGCPVICSNTSSLPEVVGNAAMTFNPNSSEELKFNIEKMILDNTLRTFFINKGFKQIKKFTWEKCALKTHEIYRSIL